MRLFSKKLSEWRNDHCTTPQKRAFVEEVMSKVMLIPANAWNCESNGLPHYGKKRKEEYGHEHEEETDIAFQWYEAVTAGGAQIKVTRRHNIFPGFTRGSGDYCFYVDGEEIARYWDRGSDKESGYIGIMTLWNHVVKLIEPRRTAHNQMLAAKQSQSKAASEQAANKHEHQKQQNTLRRL